MQKKQVKQIFQRLALDNPNPTTELNYSSGFELLVAVILSAQATDLSVNKVTANLFKLANTPETILGLGLDQLKSMIKTIGLFNMKAANIIKMSQILIDQYNAQVPNTLEDLQKLPGVGRKTANVILNTLYAKPVIAVDTHILRVSKRIGFTDSITPDKVETDLMHIIPTEYLLNAHHWLILHGRYICKARNPLCHTCHIANFCRFFNRTLQVTEK